MNPCFQQWVFSFLPFSSTLLVFDHSVHSCVLVLPLFFVTRGKLRDPPMQLRSGRGPTSPRDDLHQCTQCVKASCLNPVSAVTGLAMWQGRSVDAVDVLPVVGNRGNKCGPVKKKQCTEKWRYPSTTPTNDDLCPQCGPCQAAWKYIHILAADSAHQALNTCF